MSWHAELDLSYSVESGRCVARHHHTGPLRVLKTLYPEGDSVCHNVLVHPPGGLVGGDTLTVRTSVAEGAHGLITTPGAARFYRSDGELARQITTLTLAPGARMEWLPLESLLYSGCLAENRLSMRLAPGAELLGWDVTCLGLPHAGLAFERGLYTQHIEMPGVWLERGLLRAGDRRLIDSPLGLAGSSCVATLFFASGDAIDRGRRERALDAARECIRSSAIAPTAGATSPNRQVLAMRILAPFSEPAMLLLRSVWSVWRQELWGRAAIAPRIWAM
jgi:urease accessory protein